MKESVAKPIRVGDVGRAQTLMCPSGIVIVEGIRYSARSSEGVIQGGEEVFIVRGDNSGLVVLRAGLVENVATLPQYGNAVYASFGDAIAAKGQRQEETRRRWAVLRSKWLKRVGPLLGLVHGLLIAWWCKDMLAARWGADQVWLSMTVLAVGGALLGYPLLAFVDRALRGLDESLHRASLASTSLSLIAGTLMLREATAQFGMHWGVFMGAAAALLAAIPVPLLLVLIGAQTGEGDAGGDGVAE